MRCVGLLFSEEDVKTNWVNRKVGDLSIELPTTFEELEQFMNGYLLNCFLNMNKEAI